MPQIALATVPVPRSGERIVIGYTSYPEHTPFSVGSGDTDLVCGECSFVLLKTVTTLEPRPSAVIRCPECGGYNDLDTAPKAS